MILVISFFVRCQLRCRRLIYISWPARRSFAQSRAMPGYAPRSELTKASVCSTLQVGPSSAIAPTTWRRVHNLALVALL